MTLHTLHFGAPEQLATAELLARFESLRPEFTRDSTPAMQRLREELRTLQAIDRQHGGTGPLPLEDAPALAAAAITDLAHLEHDSRQQGFTDLSYDLAHLALGVGLWAVRHEVPLAGEAVEHLTNALAALSNSARDKAELSAIYGLMQAFIGHLAPELAADPDRSDPRRPWRLMHVNLAVTAIRTEDEGLMEGAFDALDAALPEERAGFYAEALSIALNPKIAVPVREAIERRHQRWNAA